MGGYGVSEVGTGGDELFDRMVNGTDLTLGPTAGQERVGVTGLWGQRLVSTMNSWRLGDFAKSD